MEFRDCALLSSQRRRPTTWRAAWKLSFVPWRRLWRRWVRKLSRNTSRPSPSAAWTNLRSCRQSAPSTGERSSLSSITLTEVRCCFPSVLFTTPTPYPFVTCVYIHIYIFNHFLRSLAIRGAIFCIYPYVGPLMSQRWAQCCLEPCKLVLIKVWSNL